VLRGRVLAVEAGRALIRADGGDHLVPADPRWQPGDLVVVGAPARWPTALAGGYPGPATEVARLPRARLTHLRARATALAAVRGFFAERGFLEVETPLLVPSPGLELHLDAVAAGAGWLITSPEYQMKRLLAAGLERIYQVCRCFRGNEHGDHHSGEFTMIEWYRAWDELPSIAADTAALVAAVCTAVRGAPQAQLGDRVIDVTPPWPEVTVRVAMARWAGIELAGDEPAPALAAKVAAAGVDLGGATAWDDVFFAAWLARVEPAIGALDHPLLVTDWPAPLGALARRRDDDPRVVHRFEAYALGLELGNAFGELTDPVEQRARFRAELAERAARGRAVYPIDDKLLAALAEGLPPSAGIAVGFDRLVMLATGATRIGDVLAFTADEL
jgi:lysyl-tRNA synthetase class 2